MFKYTLYTHDTHLRYDTVRKYFNINSIGMKDLCMLIIESFSHPHITCGRYIVVVSYYYSQSATDIKQEKKKKHIFIEREFFVYNNFINKRSIL